MLIQMSQIHDCREAITRFVKNNTVDYKWAQKICTAVLEQQEKEMRAAEHENRNMIEQ